MTYKVELNLPHVRSRLYIVREGENYIIFETFAAMPCAWNRFWMWVLLGWKWEALK